MPLRLGLIGLGRWGLNIVKTLEDIPDVELSVVATQRADAASLLPKEVQIAPRHPIPEGLDAWVISSKAAYHAEDILDVARGTPVFVEKPLCLSVDELAEIEEACSKHCPIILVDHIQLFNERLVALRNRLDSAPAEFIAVTDSNNGPQRNDCSVLWDYGPHGIAAAMWLAGFPWKQGGVHVNAASVVRSDYGATVNFVLSLRGQSQASIEISNIASSKIRNYSITTPDGALDFFDGLLPTKVPPLTAALTAFVDAVRAGKAPEGDTRFGLALPAAVVRVLTQVDEVLEKRCTPLR